MTFGSENAEKMTVCITEMGDPIRWRRLMWFGNEGHSPGGQGIVGGPHILYLKNNFRCTGDMRCGMSVSATEPKNYCPALQKSQLRLLHDHRKA